MADPSTPVTGTRTGLSMTVDPDDTQRAVTQLAIAGVFAAIVLAIIGGLPFDLPMPTHAIGWVTPTCGLTRGCTAIARGDLSIAWQYNPLSFAVMAFGAYGIGRFLVGVTTHRWVSVHLRMSRYAWIAAGVAFVAFGLYQQQNADFIIHARI